MSENIPHQVPLFIHIADLTGGEPVIPGKAKSGTDCAEAFCRTVETTLIETRVMPSKVQQIAVLKRILVS